MYCMYVLYLLHKCDEECSTPTEGESVVYLRIYLYMKHVKHVYVLTVILNIKAAAIKHLHSIELTNNISTTH